MKQSLFGFTVKLRGKEFTEDQFRSLCDYEDISLEEAPDAMISSLVDMWNLMMPLSSRAELFFDGEKL